ncbi:MAG TPA: SUF system NifU family Fe-S cluster assembly protein [Candidatus Acidoferrum sp.]|nr:SUF system NifU family Fe-S cluster assembly protein [Candidatus Acidoferrum sp.]
MSHDLDDMYREIILDHYRSPRGKKPVAHADISSEGQNPSCGDEIELQVEMNDGVLKDVHVACKGCAISVASGSMLAETVKGKSFDEVKRIAEVVKKMLKGEPTQIPDDLGDLDALQGVRQFPVRIKCALLAWVTLVEGLKNYENGNRGEKTSVSTDDSE